VTDFSTVKDAKDFLANRIVAQARSENVPLSDVERKMLYWSETDWTLPDMKTVGAEFDRDYDQNEYEQKIARLIANITADRHHHNEDEEEKWNAAVHKLSDGDHYLSVLIENALAPGSGCLPTLAKPTVRPPHDFLKLLVTAFATILIASVVIVLIERFFASRFWVERGWDIDERGKGSIGFLFLFILAAGYFLVPKLWQLIRARSNRP
jgi:hypothetical protein